jgi:hypothetical protein
VNSGLARSLFPEAHASEHRDGGSGETTSDIRIAAAKGHGSDRGSGRCEQHRSAARASMDAYLRIKCVACSARFQGGLEGQRRNHTKGPRRQKASRAGKIAHLHGRAVEAVSAG